MGDVPYGPGRFANKHHAATSDLIDIAGRAQASFTYSDTAADADDLSEGIYDVWATTDCYIKVHATNAADVAANTGYIVYANTVLPVLIPKEYHLGAIRSATNGTLYYHQIG